MSRSRRVRLAVALVVAIAGANLLEWHARTLAWHTHVRLYSRGLGRAVAAVLDGLAREDGSVAPEEARALLERALARGHSGLRFVALVHDGRAIARTAGAPDGLEVVPPEGARPVGDDYVVWTHGGLALEGPRPAEAEVPREGPPPTPEELAPPLGRARLDPASRDPSGPGPGELAPPRREHTLAFGYSMRVTPAVVRGVLVDLAARLGLCGLAVGGLGLAYRAGRRAQEHASALELERARNRHLAEVGLTAAGLAHETRNPLGIIGGLAQDLLADPATPVALRARLEQVLDAADRGAARLGEFVHYARLREPSSRRVELRELAGRTLEVLASDARAAGVELAAEVEVEAVRADAEMLEQVVLNLVLNSIQASPPGSRVTVRARSSGALATIEVEDRGRGVPPELRERLFQPYVTGRADGHGLGLAIVRRLVELHGWTVELESEVGRGTRVRIGGVAALGPGEGVVAQARSDPWPGS